jgi:transcriptional regulator with GAF, ATPase, and Fis domain
MGCDSVLSSKIPVKKIGEAIVSLAQNHQEIQSEIIQAQKLADGPRLSDFISASDSMRAFMKIVSKVVKSDTSLLIQGETGVGKERLARAIHEESHRSVGPFIPINCAALPDNLLESELFGHEKGAFTGASRTRRGAFELGHKGTVFLDEIGELPLYLQAKLLRVIQEREFSHIGGEKSIKVDIRIMAATNRNLKELVDFKEFRSDLFFRLSVVNLEIPPLRERREDIPELVSGYISYLNKKIGTSASEINPKAMDALIAYDWPGNVRELINVIERALLLSDGNEIGVKELPDEISNLSFSGGASKETGFKVPPDWIKKTWLEVKKDFLDKCEYSYLEALLTETKGNIGATAVKAGMETRSIYNKMKYHRLDKKDFKNYR